MPEKKRRNTPPGGRTPWPEAAGARNRTAGDSRSAVPARPAVQQLPDPALPSFRRVPSCNMALRKDDRLKTRNRGTDDVQLGHENIDLRYLEQLADHEQTAALSRILALAEKNLLDGRKTLTQVVDAVCALMEEKGLAGPFITAAAFSPTWPCPDGRRSSPASTGTGD